MNADVREHVPIETVAQLRLIDPGVPPGDTEQSIVDTHKPIIAEALGNLERGLSRFSLELANAPFAVVFEPVYTGAGQDRRVTAYRELPHGPALEAAITAYCTLELGPDDLVNTSLQCHGAIGVHEQRVIELAKEVNRLKGALKSAFQPLTNHRITATIRRRGQNIVTKIPAALYILRQLEKSSLNRLGAYRNIPLIRVYGEYPHPPTPIAIRFTESWSQSVVKRSVDALIKDATDTGHDHTLRALQNCGIPGHEYLYSPKGHYLRVRANLTFPGASPESRKPKNYMGELPILFRLDRKMANPAVTPPKARRVDAPRARRSVPLADKPVITNPAFYRRANPSDRQYAS